MKKSSQEKLYEAALELITAQGYENTTILQIASKAGLTERTFFRKFKNKADIFFAGGEQYSEMLLNKMRESKETNPLFIVLDGYFYAADFFDEHRVRTVKRQKIIASHPDLEERELLKQSKIEGLLVEYLLITYDESTARLAVRLARAIYSVAWEEWLENNTDSLRHLLEKAIVHYNDLKND
ncbi:MAG: helix-turn-helix domain-containing protein [Lactococcus hircilactis]